MFVLSCPWTPVFTNQIEVDTCEKFSLCLSDSINYCQISSQFQSVIVQVSFSDMAFRSTISLQQYADNIEYLRLLSQCALHSPSQFLLHQPWVSNHIPIFKNVLLLIFITIQCMYCKHDFGCHNSLCSFISVTLLICDKTNEFTVGTS